MPRYPSRPRHPGRCILTIAFCLSASSDVLAPVLWPAVCYCLPASMKWALATHSSASAGAPVSRSLGQRVRPFDGIPRPGADGWRRKKSRQDNFPLALLLPLRASFRISLAQDTQASVRKVARGFLHAAGALLQPASTPDRAV